MEVFLIKALQFLMSISLLVLLHELGHFTFAKLFKVRVSRFYLFFNPKFHLISTYDTWVRRLLKLKPEVVPTKEVEETDKDGKTTTQKEKEYVGTEYGIGWLPLGGYCAIDGMIDETNQKLSEETHPWEFRTKPVWQRLLIMVGGVLVNFILAFFIYSMVLFTWGETYTPLQSMKQGMEFNEQAKAIGFQDGDILISTNDKEFKKADADMYRMLCNAKEVHVKRNGKLVTIQMPEGLSLIEMAQEVPVFVRPMVPAEIDSVIPGTPADAIGLQKGDLILAANNKQVNSFYGFTDELTRINDVLSSAKTPADSTKALQLTLVYQRGENIDTVNTALTKDLKLGFAPKQAYEPTTFEYNLFESIPAGIAYGWNMLSSYVSDLKYLFASDGVKQLGGFGAIGNLFPSVWDWHQFWLMTAFLSIILAFMNILPIPALDGGHVLFLLYEMITRKKPSEDFLIKAEYIGFGLLILLMVVANINDILRYLNIM
ncbi:RIP metalloprotease RseP [Prevotella sp. E2-28]|uniref:RIP metalloprotease RseP n=1 Tax=Prevotella sp. E2-28 TaxID=2913620 RepID=UPI001EDAACAB|nr:RIP metalloprotease RseP [Prevotella sp. E2-28]UKK54011.1 RIP metalloprotease RseP [Prevotella sp. E2-28]